MSLIQPGRYSARVVKHEIGRTKNDDEQAVVTFSFLSPDGVRELKWYGSFKPKALEFTLKALIACGLEGMNPANNLEIGKEVSIVVEIDKDISGKERNVIRWVNEVNPPKASVNKAEAIQALEKYSGAVAKLKASLNVSDYDEDLGF